jgi:ubiquinone/menaquinone biosynthesis C-methylase UbiE
MLEVMEYGSGLQCPETGDIFPYENGRLDFLQSGGERSFVERTLDTKLTAWLYDQFRGSLCRALHLPRFSEELQMIQTKLQLGPGDVVLDLACGAGNFTVELAQRVGRTGFVIGLDRSIAMLDRASKRVADYVLDNVLLIRGDAHQLPLATRSLRAINCSGGFHQFPDLPQALREIARVSLSNAVLTASTFAEVPDDPRARLKERVQRATSLQFVSLPWLGEQLESLGYVDYEWSLPGGWFGYTSSKKGY